MNQPDKNDNNCDRHGKIRTFFDQLSNAYAKFYKPLEHLLVDEIIMPFKG
jgi:hypothetical protein